MAPNIKRVFYVNHVSAPIFLELLGQRPDIQVDKLVNDSPEEEVAPVLARAHAFQISSARQELARKFHGTTALLERLPNVVVLSTTGAGFDTVNLADCTKAGVAVVNQAGGNREGVAEHVMAMMLSLSKRLMLADHAMRRGLQVPRREFMGDDLVGRTIGIIGLGNVGSRVAELCRGLFQMRVLAYDPYLSASVVAARGAEKVEVLDDLLRQSDYVSINCPHTAETLGMLGAREYALMQPHAYLITTARGGIHDEAALAEALRAGRLAGAGLDVWEEEPPPTDHPLLAMDNVLVSPHIAGITRQSRHNIARIAAEQLLGVLDGKRPPRLLNPEVWPAYRDRFEGIMGFRPEE
jgi:D-3-phosphoglycerate dehydrogenase